MSGENGVSSNGVGATAHRPSKTELKRMQIYEERRKRLLNRGVPPEKVDAELAAEDYRALPIEDKFQRLEGLVMGAIQGLRNDILSLHKNDSVIGEAFEINLAAMEKFFELLGIDKTKQMEVVKQAEQAFHERQAQEQKAREDAIKKLSEEREQEALKKDVDSSGDQKPPEDAVVFGD